MTLLSRKIDYALLILSHLYGRDDGASAREIAERFGLSRAFVANILKELCHKGFVSSHRGVKGGYSFLRPAEDVVLAELIESLDESFRLTECLHDQTPNDSCTLFHSCPVRGPMGEVHRRILDVLRGVTLAELFRPVPQPLLPVLATLSVREPCPVPTAN